MEEKKWEKVENLTNRMASRKIASVVCVCFLPPALGKGTLRDRGALEDEGDEQRTVKSNPRTPCSEPSRPFIGARESQSEPAES